MKKILITAILILSAIYSNAQVFGEVKTNKVVALSGDKVIIETGDTLGLSNVGLLLVDGTVIKDSNDIISIIGGQVDSMLYIVNIGWKAAGDTIDTDTTLLSDYVLNSSNYFPTKNTLSETIDTLKEELDTKVSGDSYVNIDSIGSGLTYAANRLNLGGALTQNTEITGNYDLKLGTDISPLSGIYNYSGANGYWVNDETGGGQFYQDKAAGGVFFNLGRNSGDASGGFYVQDGRNAYTQAGAGIYLQSDKGDGDYSIATIYRDNINLSASGSNDLTINPTSSTFTGKTNINVDDYQLTLNDGNGNHKFYSTFDDLLLENSVGKTIIWAGSTTNSNYLSFSRLNLNTNLIFNIGRQKDLLNFGNNYISLIYDSTGLKQDSLFFGVDSTGSVTANEGNFTKFNLDTNTNNNPSEGDLYYNPNTRAIESINDLPDFTHQLGYEHVARYYNNTGGTITNGTLLTPVGQKINGVIVPTVRKAGIGSVDSLALVAMSTTATLNGEYGVVTLIGAVNGLNTSAFNDNDFVYPSFDGTWTDTAQDAPYYTKILGKVFYADNDSGVVYMFPEKIEFNKPPHFASDTSDLNETVTINTQNVYEYLPIGNTVVDDNIAFTLTGDSIQVQVTGKYTIVLSTSFQGNPSTETWNYGIFVNNVLEHKKTRTTSSNAAGDTNVPISRSLTKDDWISFRIRNTSGTGDPTVVDLGVELIFLKEE